MAKTVDTSSDGWIDFPVVHIRREGQDLALRRGDTVLYLAADRSRKPATLLAQSDDGGWLAHGAQPVPQRLYLAVESIILRLPHNDLTEAA